MNATPARAKTGKPGRGRPVKYGDAVEVAIGIRCSRDDKAALEALRLRQEREYHELGHAVSVTYSSLIRGWIAQRCKQVFGLFPLPPGFVVPNPPTTVEEPPPVEEQEQPGNAALLARIAAAEAGGVDLTRFGAELTPDDPTFIRGADCWLEKVRAGEDTSWVDGLLLGPFDLWLRNKGF